ncbi:MAG: hypothetical protein H0X62_13310, partial [Bacteroidetes bacterium]|nr:hypothetical protein [Bacteroidota bacterium]
MRLLVRKLSIFLSILLFQGLSGQNEYREQVFRYSDGLASDVIHSTHVNSSGHLYIATQRGISLYDGYRFVNHTTSKARVTTFNYHEENFYYHDLTGLNTIKTIFSEPELLLPNNFMDADPNN